MTTRNLAYVSGAPRVSTRLEAAASGPRAHVLGVIGAFERHGWKVRSYIVGDRVPLQWVVGEKSERILRASAFKRVLADLTRFSLGIANGWRAHQELKGASWVYERFGAFQSLGWWFQRAGVPWILETNELYYINAANDRRTTSSPKLLKAHEKWAYQQCDALVCISKSLADLVIEEAGINPQKIIILPNGTDTIRFDPDKVNPKRIFQDATIGFVGHLSAWQRLDILIEALAELRRETIFLNLLVLGDGPMREAWEALSIKLGLSKHVKFVGRVPWSSVPGYIAGFDLGYSGPVPLTAGAMYLSPLKLYEYAAMGKPIIAATYDDILRLNKDNVPCFLFKPGDKADLKNSLRQAYGMRSQWQSMGIQAREVITKNHSWDARVQQLIAHVESILEAKYGTPYPTRRTGHPTNNRKS